MGDWNTTIKTLEVKGGPRAKKLTKEGKFMRERVYTQ